MCHFSGAAHPGRQGRPEWYGIWHRSGVGCQPIGVPRVVRVCIVRGGASWPAGVPRVVRVRRGSGRRLPADSVSPRDVGLALFRGMHMEPCGRPPAAAAPDPRRRLVTSRVVASLPPTGKPRPTGGRPGRRPGRRPPAAIWYAVRPPSDRPGHGPAACLGSTRGTRQRNDVATIGRQSRGLVVASAPPISNQCCEGPMTADPRITSAPRPTPAPRTIVEKIWDDHVVVQEPGARTYLRWLASRNFVPLSPGQPNDTGAAASPGRRPLPPRKD